MDSFKDDLNWRSVSAKISLDVIVIGAGIAGLTTAIGLRQTGHDVEVLEQVEKVSEIGAGIQMGPNAMRIFGRFGILEEILKYTNLLELNSVRRWQNDEELCIQKLMPEVAQQYNAPMGGIHRGELQRVLVDAAVNAGVRIRTSARVVRADDNFDARVQLASGEWLSADIVIAADGIKSAMRHQISEAHGIKDRALPTGDAAYRIQIPQESMSHDPEALSLLNTNMGLRYIGPGGHIMCYPIRNNKVYNMVLLHPEKRHSENDESWNRKGSKAEMLEFYKDWNSVVTNLMKYVPEGEVMEWTLNSHDPLVSWHENKIILAGDACHPMLPYVAQGGAQAIEDAGVLAAAFALVADRAQLPLAVRAYEALRKARAERIAATAAQVRESLHLPDGESQAARDRSMRDASAGRAGAENPDRWSDREFQQYIWGVDVMRQILEGWDGFVEEWEGERANENGV